MSKYRVFTVVMSLAGITQIPLAWAQGEMNCGEPLLRQSIHIIKARHLSITGREQKVIASLSGYKLDPAIEVALNPPGSRELASPIAPEITEEIDEAVQQGDGRQMLYSLDQKHKHLRRALMNSINKMIGQRKKIREAKLSYSVAGTEFLNSLRRERKLITLGLHSFVSLCKQVDYLRAELKEQPARQLRQPIIAEAIKKMQEKSQGKASASTNSDSNNRDSSSDIAMPTFVPPPPMAMDPMQGSAFPGNIPAIMPPANLPSQPIQSAQTTGPMAMAIPDGNGDQVWVPNVLPSEPQSF